MSIRIGFARWRSSLASGGNTYDDELAAGLRARGLDVREYPVTGPWPLPGPDDRASLAELLAAEEHWLIGNIVASAAPDLIAAAERGGRRVAILMHYFPADDPSLAPADRTELARTEAEAIAAASTIVVTSRWAAETVAARYGRHDAVVAVPGLAPAPLAAGSISAGEPAGLLWLGRITRGKDPLTFTGALAGLGDLDWRARLVGPDTLDEDLTRGLRERIAGAGLEGRIEVPGQRHGPALAALWGRTDLLVHTSRVETYGMVVAEALARGIPSIVAAGTGAAEAQQVGAAFPPGDAAALADTLRAWLTDPTLRAAWRAEAAERSRHVQSWPETARVVAAALAY